MSSLLRTRRQAQIGQSASTLVTIPATVPVIQWAFHDLAGIQTPVSVDVFFASMIAVVLNMAIAWAQERAYRKQ